jgi:hypothetical protein
MLCHSYGEVGLTHGAVNTVWESLAASTVPTRAAGIKRFAGGETQSRKVITAA